MEIKYIPEVNMSAGKSIEYVDRMWKSFNDMFKKNRKMYKKYEVN